MAAAATINLQNVGGVSFTPGDSLPAVTVTYNATASTPGLDHISVDTSKPGVLTVLTGATYIAPAGSIAAEAGVDLFVFAGPQWASAAAIERSLQGGSTNSPVVTYGNAPTAAGTHFLTTYRGADGVHVATINLAAADNTQGSGGATVTDIADLVGTSLHQISAQNFEFF